MPILKFVKLIHDRDAGNFFPFDYEIPIAGSPEFRLDMQLAPGDVQLLSNHTIVHARTAYEDDPDGEAGRRHLLRLWLSIE